VFCSIMSWWFLLGPAGGPVPLFLFSFFSQERGSMNFELHITLVETCLVGVITLLFFWV
jgi:hypothetical protein